MLDKILKSGLYKKIEEFVSKRVVCVISATTAIVVLIVCVISLAKVPSNADVTVPESDTVSSESSLKADESSVLSSDISSAISAE